MVTSIDLRIWTGSGFYDMITPRQKFKNWVGVSKCGLCGRQFVAAARLDHHGFGWWPKGLLGTFKSTARTVVVSMYRWASCHNCWGNRRLGAPRAPPGSPEASADSHQTRLPRPGGETEAGAAVAMEDARRDRGYVLESLQSFLEKNEIKPCGQGLWLRTRRHAPAVASVE